MKTFPEKFGARYLLYHRADLHNGLKALAYKNGATIRTSSQVSKIDCESGEIVLTDGSVHHKDLVIAADGIHVSYYYKSKLFTVLISQSRQ